LALWRMGQSIYASRASLAKALGIEESKIRFIDKYNGCTCGAANAAARFDPYIAYMAKATARPVKLMLPKDQELAHITIKPENMTKFKVGAKKDGRNVALTHEIHIANGRHEDVDNAHEAL